MSATARGGQSSAESLVPVRVADLELLRCVGEGNYGEVWLGRTVTGTYRAIKVVRRARFTTSEPYDREYRAILAYEPISRTHPALASILHVGRNEAETWFHYVMELADDAGWAVGETGESPAGAVWDQPVVPARYRPRTLAEDLRREGRLPVAACVQLGLTLADALAHLHEHGLVHRDVKPENVIYLRGSPKLADPGSVKRVELPGTMIGTEGFIPPEGPGTPAGDVFGLGRLLYECSTGMAARECPRAPDDLAAWREHQEWLELNEVLCRACEPDPRRRYGSARALRADLLMLQSGRSLRRERRVHRALAMLRRAVATLGIIVLAVLGLAAWQRRVANELATLAEANRRALSQTYVVEGLRRLELGDTARSMPCFLEALRLDEADPARVALHRFRIEALLGDCPRVRVAGTHEGALFDAIWSPDGERVVTAGSDFAARVWSARTGESVGSPCVHSNEVRAVAIDAGSRRFATGSEDGTARVWGLADGRPLTPPLPHSGPVRSVAFAPDGTALATAGRDGVARIWDSVSGRLLAELRGHEDELFQVAWAAGGDRVVTASNDRTARLWDPRDGRLVAVLQHPDGVNRSVFDSSGERIATGCDDGGVRIWEARAGRLERDSLRLQVPIRDLQFDRSGRRLVAGGGDRLHRGEAVIFEVATGARLAPPIEHGADIRRVALSPDGTLCATRSDDEMVRLSSVNGVRHADKLLPHGDLVRAVAFSPDGGRLLTASRDRHWRIWDIRGALESSGEVALERGRHLSAEAMGDGRVFVTASGSGGSRVWNASTGKLERELPWTAGVVETAAEGERAAFAVPGVGARVFDLRVDRTVFEEQGDEASAPVSRMRLSASGRRLMVCRPRAGAALRVYDVDSGERLLEVRSLPGEVIAACFTPEESALVIACGADGDDTGSQPGWGELRVLDVTGQRTQQLLPQETRAEVVCFGPRGTRLLSATSDKTFRACSARLWDWDGRRLTEATPPLRHPDGVSVAVYNRDGTLIATGGDDGTLAVWDAATGALVMQKRAHRRGVLSLAFSPDGLRLASSSADHTARLWEARTLEAVSPVWVYPRAVYAVRFGADGRSLVIVESEPQADGEVRLRRLSATGLPLTELAREIEAAAGWRMGPRGALEPIAGFQLGR